MSAGRELLKQEILNNNPQQDKGTGQNGTIYEVLSKVEAL